jgi:RNA polymerase sigma factor (sigma-70 family)
VRAIDAVKKRSQRSRKLSPLAHDGPADRSQEQVRQTAESRQAIKEAAQALTPRQQRIIQLSFDGWSVQHIAMTMRLPAARISDEKYKAIHKLHDRLATAG